MFTASETELKQQITKLQQVLQAAGISAALLFQDMNLYYYTAAIGTDCLYVPAEDLPIFLSRRREKDLIVMNGRL